MEAPAKTPATKLRVSALLLLGGCAAFLLLVGAAMAIWGPVHRQKLDIDEIRRLGGEVEVITTPLRVWDFDLSDLGLSQSVRGVDMSHVAGSDESVDLVTGFSELQYLALYGPNITDAAIAPLKRLSKLSELVLVHCPGISSRAETDLAAALPKLKITRRGPAWLGIGGSRGPSLRTIVQVVIPHTAADKAGIKAGDVITAINGQPNFGFDSLIARIAEFRPGDRVQLEVLRGAETISIEVTLGAWENTSESN